MQESWSMSRRGGLRAVFCDWNTPYKQLLDWAGLPTLTNRRLQEVVEQSHYSRIFPISPKNQR